MTYTTHKAYTPLPPIRRCACLVTRRVAARDDALLFGDVMHRGSGGRRRSADAELWRPCEPDVARGNRGGVGSLALPSRRA